MKKLKLLPPFITLLAGAITSIIAYVFHYPFNQTLLLLFIVLVVFYFLGVLAMKLIAEAPPKKNHVVSDEGEVVEKETRTKVDTKTESNAEKG